MTRRSLILRNVVAVAICLAGVTIFLGCQHEEPFVAVTSISDVPTTTPAGTPLILTGTVNPDNATNKNITWSVENTGTTGANISINILTATAEGTAEVLATVVGGGKKASQNYTQLFSITVTAAVPFSGEGLEGAPWIIANANDLAKMSELISAGTSPYADANKYYRLENNIPLLTQGGLGNHTPIGTWDKPFKGNFDGNGKTISNLIIDKTSTDNIGLFGVVSDGTVQNLGLVNVNIKGRQYTGGIVGVNDRSSANITNCYVTGSVSGTVYVGGIAGVNKNNASINNCYTTCSVSGNNNNVGGIAGINELGGLISKCYATGAISGTWQIGGIAGINDSGGLMNCYATGAISGTQYVGGIAGVNRNNASISNCYTTCSVSSSLTCVGGIAGINRLDGIINKCYATGAISGTSGVGGIVGWHQSGTISCCVALNPSINRTEGTGTNFGRVIGGFDTVNTFINNAALDAMKTNSGVSLTSGDKNGTAITAAAATSQDPYTSRTWGFGTTTASPWKWTVGSGANLYKLPVFYWQNSAPGAMPTHLK